jgi:hypothetical protein
MESFAIILVTNNDLELTTESKTAPEVFTHMLVFERSLLRISLLST